MILVTGATGTIGREVVRLLAAGGERVRAMTRTPGKIASPAPGVEVVRGDFTDPESLVVAADGATAVFMLSAPGPWMAEHDEAMLAAARSAGVPRAVKLSAIGTGDHADGRAGDWHLSGEQAVRSGGLAWTVLRPSWFASNTLRWAEAVRAGRPIPNPMRTGAQGVVDPADVAEVAARTLTSPGHDGHVYTLTGPEPLSIPDMAVRLGETIGRTVETVEVPLDDRRDRLSAAGLDPVFVETAVAGARLVAEGRNATVTGDVERVLGRAPRTFAAWAHDHRAAFTG
ncbi:SDR family oxidoreductase [Microbispora amethystogenes]|uniref:Nucleotide-diphosphate-sugar epimerase n=1 Tax=Microbispora amethystogenes TaxID=1427754 RepID=A0ABQ4FJ50_9ACTN|nr:SDR family oxidoreductase [Microbispora amethystogenes]GIH34825.1 nucleotide-diphosphate-sugar epimerase [Microbispora amethystogenes]